MKLEGDYVFDAPVRNVWDALFDPQVLAAVMPGCEKLELVDGRYIGELNIKIGPVQGKFSGAVDLKDIDEPSSYTLILDGRGQPGFVKATASVKLLAEGNTTRLVYDADAQVGGKIASIGQRLVDASAKAIARQSLEGLHANIKVRMAAAAQAAEAAAPPPGGSPADAAVVTGGTDGLGGGAVLASAPGAPPGEVAAPGAVTAPAPPLVRADPSAFAASVAREVSASLVPPAARLGIAVAVGILIGALGMWLAMR